MRTETTTRTLYTFDELSESAQQKVIEKLSGINVDFDWWSSTYEDAKNIGLEITSFDLDRNKHAKGEILSSHTETADLIIKNHGEMCETYKLAHAFLSERNALVVKYSDGIDLERVTEDNEQAFDDECDDLENEFKNNLLEEYANILQLECEYLQSEEAIKETIEANEYEFDEDGNLA